MIRFFIRSVYLLAILSISVASTGIVKWFNEHKGYGFIIPDTGTPGGRSDVFVHYTAIRTGDRVLHGGDRVYFELVLGPKGRTAANVARI